MLFSQGSKATVPTSTAPWDVQLQFITGTPETLLDHIQEWQEKEKATLLGWEAKSKGLSVKTEGKDNAEA